MHSDIARVLYSYEQLEQRIAELGAQISADYKGKSILAVGILRGATIFYADLVRNISCDVRFDFMAVSSYGSTTVTTGAVRFLKDLDTSIEGHDVLIIEDIVDSGLTLTYLTEALRQRKPASIRVCCLLDKPSRRKSPLVPDYCGFQIPDAFVVGFGLDFAEKYRNLPYIGVLKPEIYL